MIRIPELAPCGVYCGACPSFGKSCRGCADESREQGRSSKWGCKVRVCCYEQEQKDFCIECEKFPCKAHKKKLLDTHPEDPRFKYRHEVPANFSKMKEKGIDDYLRYQKERWACPSCGGTVYFYHYRCGRCKREVSVPDQ